MDIKNFSEHDLCNALIKALDGTEFRMFGEYCDWDIVVNRGNILFGIQAKLQLNTKAIAQTIRADGVDFKVILVKDYKAKLNDPYIDILGELKIILVNYGFIDNQMGYKPGMRFTVINDFRQGYDRRWLYKWRHRPYVKLQIPDFDYTVKAGVASPRKVSEYNINLVRLELFALKQPKAAVSLAQIRSFGMWRVPKYYFYYNWDDKKWFLNENPKRRPSFDFPHIALGLRQKEKLDAS